MSIIIIDLTTASCFHKMSVLQQRSVKRTRTRKRDRLKHQVEKRKGCWGGGGGWGVFFIKQVYFPSGSEASTHTVYNTDTEPAR